MKKFKEVFKDDLIIELCKKKDVIHFGACDSPYTIEKAKNGTLLHQKLMNVCNNIVGFDIDKNMIDILKSEYLIDNIHYCDIMDKNSVRNAFKLLNNKNYDYIIFGDIIEHLNCPEKALKNLAELVKYTNSEIILTTPNVFNLFNLSTYITGKENVHPDHFFWPSKKTMDKLLTSCGFKTKEFRYMHHGGGEILNKNFRGILGEMTIFTMFPHLRGTLFYILEVNR